MTINIEKRYAYFFVGLLVLATSMLAVNAYGGNDPAIVGHNAEEIDWNDLIFELNVNEICLGEDCRATWPTFIPPIDTYCIINGGNFVCPDGLIKVINNP